MKSDYVDMDMLRRIGMVRKRVMQLLRLISTKADVVKSIITRYMNQIEPSGPISGVYVETKFYLEGGSNLIKVSSPLTHLLYPTQPFSRYPRSCSYHDAKSNPL
jgi:hypothetical protein